MNTDMNMNTAVIITRLKTMHWITLYHGIRNDLYVL